MPRHGEKGIEELIIALLRGCDPNGVHLTPPKLVPGSTDDNFLPAITNGGRSVLRVGCHESRAPFALYGSSKQYETFFCDQRNTLLYRTLAELTLPTPFRRKHNAKT